MQKMADGASAPALVHQDLDVALRVVRDLFTSDVERVSIDSAADYTRILEFVEATMPRLASRVHHYQGTTPLFERVFGLTSLDDLPALDDLGADAEDLRERLEAVAGRRGA